jgi:hypothetical protein
MLIMKVTFYVSFIYDGKRPVKEDFQSGYNTASANASMRICMK